MGRLLIGCAITFMVAAPAWAETCESLYYQRNNIYKTQGYCFKTTRAIRAFGNAGCQFDDVTDVPLSARQRAVIQEIKSEERSLDCSE